MGATVSRNDFTYSYSDEPHATRRKLILQKYPQVRKLMGVDHAFKWQVLCLVLAQLSSFYLLRNVKNFWLLFPLAYFVGGVANHAIMLAIHEISHGMAFGTSKPLANKLYAIFANLPLGVPMSISFKKYHLEHHRYQGDELLDTDIPTDMEAAFFTSPLRKCIWCLLQPFFYTMRPLFVNPKPVETFELINIGVQLVFDLFIIKYLGWHILVYMIGGVLLAMGLHPVAGHFISEHTLLFKNEDDTPKDGNNNSETRDKQQQQNLSKCDDGYLKNTKVDRSSMDKAQGRKTDIKARTVNDEGKFLVPETCSYYGPLNWVTFNVGYHVEHHDFPSIPGSRLHMLSEIAPEFYLNLNYHTSWAYVLWQYITDPNVGPAARVRRPHSLRKDKPVS